MATDVFKVMYEVPADNTIVEAFYEARQAAQDRTWAYVTSVGGIGYYTSGWKGGLACVVFEDPDRSLWKVVGEAWHEGKRAFRCVPKRTKIAAETLAAFEAVAPIPKTATLAEALGWSGETPSSGKAIHFATVSRLLLPEPRIFLCLPRVIGDGWVAPDFFTERTEGDYMRAIEAHNALVAK